MVAMPQSIRDASCKGLIGLPKHFQVFSTVVQKIRLASRAKEMSSRLAGSTMITGIARRNPIYSASVCVSASTTIVVSRPSSYVPLTAQNIVHSLRPGFRADLICNSFGCLGKLILKNRCGGLWRVVRTADLFSDPDRAQRSFRRWGGTLPV